MRGPEQRERRQHPRVEYQKEVIAYVAMRRLRCVGRDLGAGGICIAPPRGAAPGERLRLNLHLERGHTVVVDGEVLRVDNDDRRHWGISFARVPRAIRTQIADYVDGVLQRGGGTSDRRPAVRPDTPTPAVPPPLVDRGERPTPDHRRKADRHERETYGRETTKRAGPVAEQRERRETPFSHDEDSLEALRKRHQQLAKRGNDDDDER